MAGAVGTQRDAEEAEHLLLQVGQLGMEGLDRISLVGQDIPLDQTE